MIIQIELRKNFVFMAMLVAVFVFGMYGLVKVPNSNSSFENRSLNQFSHFTLKDFVDGSFQDNFEGALSDQFLASEKIRNIYGKAISGLPTFGINDLFCTNRYVDVPGSSEKNKRYFFNCEDYMVDKPNAVTENRMKNVLNNINIYNRINAKIGVYYYFIENFRVFNFEKNELVVDYASILRENLRGNFVLKVFEMNGFDDHKKYFYKTDHHWNYVGSYKGYSEVIGMFGMTPIDPSAIYTNGDIFYGSHVNATRDYDVKEEFMFYDFDFAEHDTYVNGKKMTYGHYKEYKDHQYSKVTDYYHYVYGKDLGEVIFDFHYPEKENLLIISDSYGDAIKETIAQHFNKTFAIDLRYYKSAIGTDFKIDEYIANNNIDKVLFIMNPPFLTGVECNQGLEL